MKPLFDRSKLFDPAEAGTLSPEQLRLAYAGQQLPFRGGRASFGCGNMTLNYNDLGYNDLGYNDLGYNDLSYNDLSYTESGLGERARNRDSGYYSDSYYSDSYYRDFGGSGSDTSYDANYGSSGLSYSELGSSVTGEYSDYHYDRMASSSGSGSTGSKRRRTPAPKRAIVPGAKKIMSIWGEILALIYMLYPAVGALTGRMSYDSDYSGFYPLFGVFFDGRSDYDAHFFARFLAWHFTLAALLMLVLWTIACVRREKQFGEDTGSAVGKYFRSYFLIPVGIYLCIAGFGALRGDMEFAECIAVTGFILWIFLFVMTLVNTSRLKKQ